MTHEKLKAAVAAVKSLPLGASPHLRCEGRGRHLHLGVDGATLQDHAITTSVAEAAADGRGPFMWRAARIGYGITLADAVRGALASPPMAHLIRPPTLHVGIGRHAMGLLGDHYAEGIRAAVVDGLTVTAHSAGGVILVRRDEQGTPIPGPALDRIDTVASAVLAVAGDCPAVHLGTTNAGAALLAEAGGVCGWGATLYRIGLRYRGVDFLAWLDPVAPREAGEIERVPAEGRRECDHGAIGGKCCPTTPAAQPKGLHLEVRGDMLRVECDYLGGRVYRLWRLEGGALPAAGSRLAEALVLGVVQIAEIAEGAAPRGWQWVRA